MTSVEASAASISMAACKLMPPMAALGSRPPVPNACDTPSPSAWIWQLTSCRPVPEAPTKPMRPRRTWLANPSGTPPTMAVPQSGPITSRPWAWASCLMASSCSSETLSENRNTSKPALIALSASAAAYAPGTEICARPALLPASCAAASAIDIDCGDICCTPGWLAAALPASSRSASCNAAATRLPSWSSASSTSTIRSAARAARRASLNNPACSSIALLASVPISSVARATPVAARTSSAMRISATESLYRLLRTDTCRVMVSAPISRFADWACQSRPDPAPPPRKRAHSMRQVQHQQPDSSQD